MNNPTVTFVTAFIDLNEDRSKYRSTETRIKLFKQFANSGVAICLFVSSQYENIGKDLANEFKNVKLMTITNLEDLEIYKLITNLNPKSPSNINKIKDTMNFIILMNCKTEFLYNILLINPFNTAHFAWIDFSIFHIINNIDKTISQLQLIGYSKLKEKMLLFPCCWSHEFTKEHIHSILSSILWRFCGGFFIGDKQSIHNMHNLIIDQLPNFINQNNVIVWEVNIWTWLEVKHNWKIDYYFANHNDTILDVPKEYISVVNNLTPNPLLS